MLKRFFEDPLHQFYLVLGRDICGIFADAILKVEGNKICGNEAIKVVQDLQNKLKAQIDAAYISIQAEQALRKASQSDESINEIEIISNVACRIYRKFTFSIKIFAMFVIFFLLHSFSENCLDYLAW